MKTPELSPSQVQHAWRCAAICDARLIDDDLLRSFRYEEDRSPGVVMAKYENGGGDEVVAFFTADGRAVIKGFDHESEVSPHAREEYAIWPGLYEGLPPDLLALLQQDADDGGAADIEEVTFCCWSEDGRTWKTGTAVIPDEIDDGAEWMLFMVQMDADAFIEWGESYYGEDFAQLGDSAVRDVFERSA